MTGYSARAERPRYLGGKSAGRYGGMQAGLAVNLLAIADSYS